MIAGEGATVVLYPIPTTAEEWAARLSKAGVSEQERDAFRAWLEAHPENRKACEDVIGIEALFRAIDRDSLPDLLAEVETVQRRWSWRVPAAIAAGIALLAFAAIVAVPVVDGEMQRAATRHGEQRSVMLPDGSVVQLNTDTQIAYRVDSRARHVELRSGEAFFDVAKDEARKFTVKTPAAEIQVVGTQFSVRTLVTDVEVIVKEGRVNVIREGTFSPARLLGGAPKILLLPNERVRIPAMEEEPPRVAMVDANRATAWRVGVLDIDGMSLEEVVAEVNRYLPLPFAIEDDSIRRLRLSGRFKLGDPQNIRFMLRERLNVDSAERGDHIALTSARP